MSFNNVDQDDDSSEEYSEVELEFKALCDEALPKIEAQLTIAREAIKQAEKISEQYGVPFSSDITPIGMAYTPASMDDRFRDLEDVIYDFTGSYLNDYEGWEHSAVC